ncbi:ATP-binding protein [Marinobacterium litorale]|jgi:two-component system sensor histidine kinase QseC|uniref:ATP-binding protein n=1 Tax=Marinobacterium litorale TaxID=404770 RepID=UPI000418F98B|nr:ATP-binding protein [Marinobacterium litorale]
MTSISRALTLSLLTIGLLSGLTTAYLAYDSAMDEAEELFDAQMAQMARLIQQLAPHDTSLAAVVDRERHWALAHPYEEQLAYRILDNNSRPLIASPSFPQWIEPTATLGYQDMIHGTERWRMFTLEGREGRNHIQVIQSDNMRGELATKIAATNTLPILIFLPLLGLAIWWQVKKHLKPLVTISEEVSERGSGHLEPLQLKQVPREIKGLVVALNEMLRRLKQSFERERRFTADAAHELRTPLAALQIHCENLCQELSEQGGSSSGDQILRGLKRMNRVVEQLLELSRLDPQDKLPQTETLNLTALCRETIGEQIYFALERNIDLGLNAPATDLQVSGHPLYLSLLLRNLIDNAIRYTPAGGEVTVDLDTCEAGVRISVIDSGPGLSDEEKARVFERFYRQSNAGDGSGLGLSIVRQIAELHGSDVELLDRDDGQSGLKVSVVLTTPHSG